MRRRQGPGRIKQRLAKLLRQAGYSIEPHQLYDQKGAWRTDDRLDVCRWEAHVTRLSDGMTLLVQSWSTMTECARYGIETKKDHDSASCLTVDAKMTAADERRKLERTAEHGGRRRRAWAKAALARDARYRNKPKGATPK